MMSFEIAEVPRKRHMIRIADRLPRKDQHQVDHPRVVNRLKLARTEWFTKIDTVHGSADGRMQWLDPDRGIFPCGHALLLCRFAMAGERVGFDRR